MTTLQKETYDLQNEIPKDFMENLFLLKLDSLSREVASFSQGMDKLNERVSAIENGKEFWETPFYKDFFTIDERQRRIKTTKEKSPVIKDTIQECKKIIERSIEVLSDWSEIQDIRLQIQYASIITGKIDNIKKNDYIQSDDTRKKICTLLKSVIRINVADAVFSKEQISLIKKGFLLLLSEQIQKQDMLQLNREFLEQRLPTMPAWE